MAKRIREIEETVPNLLEEQTQGIQELMTSIAESRDALKMFVDIVKEAHEAGLLDILHGLLKARHEVGFLAIQQLNQPKMHHTIKNAMGALTFLGEVEPDQLNKLLKGVARGIERTSEQTETGHPLGIWGLTKMIRDPDLNYVLQTVLEFARGVGEQLREAPPRSHQNGNAAGGIVH